MPIQLTNTLTRQKETFVPWEPGKVKMYVCGPTVYGLTHVGNARPNVFFDTVRRYLEFSGYQVTYVSNYTDVDDKIIKRARDEKKTSLEISEKYIQEFRKDMDALGIRRPDVAPKVTDHIAQIITFIEGLVNNGSAYVASDGEVFFAVRKFAGYGKLSGRNVDELLTGVRIDPSEKKRDPLDFSLWKPRKSPEEPAWESPWGLGRPGWHIECSVMSIQYLGESFDIHGGGLDLVHPHHENEIAQAEALTHKPFAKYWMHNNLVTIENEKMAKSVGNIFLNRDFMDKYGAETLRYLLLSGHYRSPIDFSEKHIRECQSALHRLYSSIARCQIALSLPPVPDGSPSEEEKKLRAFQSTFVSRWREAMDDDFNTAKLLGYVFEYVRAANGYVDKKSFKLTSTAQPLLTTYLNHLKELSSVLNLFSEPAQKFLSEMKLRVLRERGLNLSEIEAQISQRQAAREQKDWATSDRLRKELLEKGIELRDSASAMEWDIIF